jgi:hypothetical protein
MVNDANDPRRYFRFNEEGRTLKISELITRLTEIQKNFGDLPVYTFDAKRAYSTPVYNTKIVPNQYVLLE